MIATAVLLALICVPAFAAELEIRGVWVSTVYNLDYPSRSGLSQTELMLEADAIIEDMATAGFNAIFLQVRPSADALYPSDIFPWSAYLSGTQGVAPDGDFDPLAYFIDKCHERGIALHAWINPYRISTEKSDTVDEALSKLSEGHPARDMPDCVLLSADGSPYFDPGRPESRELIISGVMELLENYDIDGIHFDDYFYPGGEFEDAETFAVFGDGYDEIGDFRRSSVNQLIGDLYTRIKSIDKEVLFGVSPFGVWANSSQHPEGSETASSQSYYSHYADTRKWVRDGIVDYIMPQLYWHIGSSEADFVTLLDWWSDVTTGTGVKLYIGMAAYRVLTAETGDIWYGADEIARQLELLQATGAAEGAVLFRYGTLMQTSELYDYVAEVFTAERERYSLPYRDIIRQPELLSPGCDVGILAGSELAFDAVSTPGSRVSVLLGGQIARLNEVSPGEYTGTFSATASDSGTLNDLGPPLLVHEQNGFLRVTICDYKVTSVQSVKPVSITRIYTEDTLETHTITFVTGTPVGGNVSALGNLLRLEISPCKMAVLFESDYIESIAFHTEDESGVYLFSLPDGHAGHSYRLEFEVDRIILIIIKPSLDTP